jgi:hypothetical protein
MFLRPFEHQHQRASWKAAFDDLQRSDVEQRFLFCVQRVEWFQWSVF